MSEGKKKGLRAEDSEYGDRIEFCPQVYSPFAMVRDVLGKSSGKR